MKVTALLGLLFVACSCHLREKDIHLALNREDSNPFGWSILFDTSVIVASSCESAKAGHAPNGVLVAYRPVDGIDSLIDCWVDQDRDGRLDDCPAYRMVQGVKSKSIDIPCGPVLTRQSLPFYLIVRGQAQNPNISLRAHYTREGWAWFNGDSVHFKLFDSDANGLFELADGARGINLFISINDSQAKNFNINQLLPIARRFYLADSLFPDGSRIFLRRTMLRPLHLMDNVSGIRMNLLDGSTLSLKEVKGTWCELDFCRDWGEKYWNRNFREAMAFHESTKDSVRLISVVISHRTDSSSLREELTALNLPWEVAILGEDSELWKRLGAESNLQLPFRILINPQGLVQALGGSLYKIWIGQNAPDFAQADTVGNPVSLSSLRGSYVLLDFWASWCAPCIEQLPEFKKADSLFRGRNLKIISVSLDTDSSSWRKAIHEYQMPWLHVSDLQGWNNRVAKGYAILSIPSGVLIDPEGRIIAKDLKGANLLTTLQQLIR